MIMIAHARDTRGIVCLAGIVEMQRLRVRLLSRKVLFLLLLIVPRRDSLFLSEHSNIPFFFDQGISEQRSLPDPRILLNLLSDNLYNIMMFGFFAILVFLLGVLPRPLYRKKM